MKNLLKKIGVIGLAIALMAPFISVPKVNAEDSNTTKHLQQYLFLDEESLYNDDLFSNVSDDESAHYKATNGYTTTTEFPYSFPTDVDVKITNVTTKPVTSADEVEKYITLHNNVIGTSNPTANSTYAKYVAKKGATNVTTALNGYDSSTILMHGQWGKYYDTKLEQMQDSTWNQIANSEKTKFVAHAIQNNSIVSSGAQATVYAGKWNASKNTVEKNGSAVFTKDYLQTIVDDVKAADDNSLLSSDKNGYTLPIAIERKVTADVSNAIFGYIPKNSNDLFVFGTLPSGTAADDAKVSNAKGTSYKKYVEWLNHAERNTKDCAQLGLCFQVKKDESGAALSLDAEAFREDPKKEAGVDFDVYGTYYWPVIVEVEYETTTNSYGVPDGKWKLVYNDNANGDSSVENMPAGETLDVGTNTKAGSAPTRKGYTFTEWCTEGKKQCYKVGETVPSGKSGELVTLYAQWKGVEGPANESPATGIASYIISFLAVGAIAGGIYYVSKKKNLFKQI